MVRVRVRCGGPTRARRRLEWAVAAKDPRAACHREARWVDLMRAVAWHRGLLLGRRWACRVRTWPRLALPPAHPRQRRHHSGPIRPPRSRRSPDRGPGTAAVARPRRTPTRRLTLLSVDRT